MDEWFYNTFKRLPNLIPVPVIVNNMDMVEFACSVLSDRQPRYRNWLAIHVSTFFVPTSYDSLPADHQIFGEIANGHLRGSFPRWLTIMSHNGTAFVFDLAMLRTVPVAVRQLLTNPQTIVFGWRLGPQLTALHLAFGPRIENADVNAERYVAFPDRFGMAKSMFARCNVYDTERALRKALPDTIVRNRMNLYGFDLSRPDVRMTASELFGIRLFTEPAELEESLRRCETQMQRKLIRWLAAEIVATHLCGIGFHRYGFFGSEVVPIPSRPMDFPSPDSILRLPHTERMYDSLEFGEPLVKMERVPCTGAKAMILPAERSRSLDAGPFSTVNTDRGRVRPAGDFAFSKTTPACPWNVRKSDLWDIKPSQNIQDTWNYNDLELETKRIQARVVNDLKSGNTERRKAAELRRDWWHLSHTGIRTAWTTAFVDDCSSRQDCLVAGKLNLITDFGFREVIWAPFIVQPNNKRILTIDIFGLESFQDAWNARQERDAPMLTVEIGVNHPNPMLSWDEAEFARRRGSHTTPLLPRDVPVRDTYTSTRGRGGRRASARTAGGGRNVPYVAPGDVPIEAAQAVRARIEPYAPASTSARGRGIAKPKTKAEMLLQKAHSLLHPTPTTVREQERAIVASTLDSTKAFPTLPERAEGEPAPFPPPSPMSIPPGALTDRVPASVSAKLKQQKEDAAKSGGAGQSTTSTQAAPPGAQPANQVPVAGTAVEGSTSTTPAGQQGDETGERPISVPPVTPTPPPLQLGVDIPLDVDVQSRSSSVMQMHSVTSVSSADVQPMDADKTEAPPGPPTTPASVDTSPAIDTRAMESILRSLTYTPMTELGNKVDMLIVGYRQMANMQQDMWTLMAASGLLPPGHPANAARAAAQASTLAQQPLQQQQPQTTYAGVTQTSTVTTVAPSKPTGARTSAPAGPKGQPSVQQTPLPMRAQSGDEQSVLPPRRILRSGTRVDSPSATQPLPMGPPSGRAPSRTAGQAKPPATTPEGQPSQKRRKPRSRKKKSAESSSVDFLSSAATSEDERAIAPTPPKRKAQGSVAPSTARTTTPGRGKKQQKPAPQPAAAVGTAKAKSPSQKPQQQQAAKPVAQAKAKPPTPTQQKPATVAKAKPPTQPKQKPVETAKAKPPTPSKQKTGTVVTVVATTTRTVTQQTPVVDTGDTDIGPVRRRPQTFSGSTSTLEGGAAVRPVVPVVATPAPTERYDYGRDIDWSDPIYGLQDLPQPVRDVVSDYLTHYSLHVHVHMANARFDDYPGIIPNFLASLRSRIEELIPGQYELRREAMRIAAVGMVTRYRAWGRIPNAELVRGARTEAHRLGQVASSIYSQQARRQAQRPTGSDEGTSTSQLEAGSTSTPIPASTSTPTSDTTTGTKRRVPTPAPSSDLSGTTTRTAQSDQQDGTPADSKSKRRRGPKTRRDSSQASTTGTAATSSSAGQSEDLTDQRPSRVAPRTFTPANGSGRSATGDAGDSAASSERMEATSASGRSDETSGRKTRKQKADERMAAYKALYAQATALGISVKDYRKGLAEGKYELPSGLTTMPLRPPPLETALEDLVARTSSLDVDPLEPLEGVEEYSTASTVGESEQRDESAPVTGAPTDTSRTDTEHEEKPLVIVESEVSEGSGETAPAVESGTGENTPSADNTASDAGRQTEPSPGGTDPPRDGPDASGPLPE